MLSTSTRISLTEPEHVLAPLRSHLAEHDAAVTQTDGRTHIAFGSAEAQLETSGGTLSVTIEAPDAGAIMAMKRMIASHLVEFAPPGTIHGLRWTGDGTAAAWPADFRLLTVTGCEQLTPHMRRIRFRGEDLSRFDTLEALHVRLFIPPAGVAEPAWPMIGEDGLLQQAPPERRPVVRKYTIREIDAAADTLSIDFVLHDEAGPGSAFAARAGRGDVIGMAGPGGRGLKAADRYLFLADETGLPAIARMLAALPADANGSAVIEIADAGEKQPLAAPPDVEISWLSRKEAASSGKPPLLDALERFDWPQNERLYLWAATEHAVFRELRAAARRRLRDGQDEQLIVSYWRAGLAEEQHAAEKAKAARKS